MLLSLSQRLSLAGAAAALVVSPALASTDANGVANFLDQHCMECHDAETAKGDVDLEPLFGLAGQDPLAVDAKTVVLWTDVLDQLNLGEMPPKKKPRPETKNLLATTGWITGTLEAHVRSAPRATTALRRLNKTEYTNTVRDLLGVTYDPGERFPADGSAHGFDNNADALKLSSPLFARYLEAAEEVAAKAVVTGAQPERKAQTIKGKAFDCELGIRRDEGIEIASNREARARVFPKQAVPADGIYKVSALVEPVRSKGKQLGVRFKTGLPDREFTIKLLDLGVHHLTETRRIEDTIFIPAGETLHVSFINGGGIPTISNQRQYKGAAVIIKELTIDGPIIETWPPKAHQQLFAPAKGERDGPAARRILTSFAQRAYRRPPTAEGIDPLMQTFHQERKAGAYFNEAIRTAVTLALCSPEFLYIAPPQSPDEQGLDAFAMASRLSYFLWSSTPDDTLLAAAAGGKLATAEGLRSEAKRLLADPRSSAFMQNFVGQWLRTRDVGAMQPDPRMFPQYDAKLEAAMRDETEAFIGHLIAENLPITNVLDSNFTFANERLARHYGIPGIKGEKLQKIALPANTDRGGVLGQASFLTVTSNGTNTSPVVRGIFVLDNLLGTPPSPPPPDVEPLEPDTRGTTTVREQLVKHRESPTCFDCHQRIDPLGLALEGFDPIGAERSHYILPGKNKKKGPVVETAAETVDGTALAGAGGLRRYLMSHSDRFAKGLAERLITYATGRAPTFLDQQDAASLAGVRPPEETGFRSLVLDVIVSDAFARR